MLDRRVGLDTGEIVSRIRASDRPMFEALFVAYYEELCDFANSYLNSPQIAEDVVSDIFAKLWEIRESWSPPATVQAYLFGLAHRRAIDSYRSRSAEEKRYLGTLSGNESWGMSAPLRPPDVLVEHLDNAARLELEVSQLTEAQRLVLSLRWRQEMSWEEIASVMNVSVAAAQMQHSRALKTLREKLR